MWMVELLVVLFFIWLGARLGSIGIGFAGGFGVLVLGVVFGIAPGAIPTDVILIIMGVIAAIAAMQEAGGLDYLVQLAEKVLKSKPKYITFLAPLVTYTMTLFAGTGHTAFMTLPVIAEVPFHQVQPAVGSGQELIVENAFHAGVPVAFRRPGAFEQGRFGLDGVAGAVARQALGFQRQQLLFGEWLGTTHER